MTQNKVLSTILLLLVTVFNSHADSPQSGSTACEEDYIHINGQCCGLVAGDIICKVPLNSEPYVYSTNQPILIRDVYGDGTVKLQKPNDLEFLIRDNPSILDQSIRQKMDDRIQ